MDKIKGAIFDLDGTLFDSLWVWAEIDKRFLGKRGFDVPPDYQQAIAAMGFRLTAEYTIKRFGLDETPEDLMNEWMEMSRDIYAHEIKLKSKAKEFLIELHSKGIKLGVATSSSPDLYIPALKNNGVYELFSVLMDTSETRGKDYPDVYLASAERLSLSPSECVVFEDLPIALKSAKSGGFKTVAIFERDEESEFADYVAKGYDELLKLIK
ncbi:MAG: HAD family phosphatase [Clostridiales bacterium]|nr:HAD family phosphatase [Clostridiales bacterium]